MKRTLLLLLLITGYSSIAQCWKMVSVGEGHAIGIKTDGTLWGWGINFSYGRVGNNSEAYVAEPVQIGTASDWKDVNAGAHHSMVIKTDGTLWGWGSNQYGQLGNGTTTSSLVPIQIGTEIWKKVSCGTSHTIGIKNDGTLWGWGGNVYAAVGDGTFIDRHLPVLIHDGSNWKTVSCNLHRNVAHRENGTLWAWGFNNPTLGHEFGFIGETFVPTVSQIGTGTNWKSAVVGNGYTLSLKTDNTYWPWGGGSNGDLGNGSTSNIFFHQQVGSDTDWLELAADGFSSFGIKQDGTLWAWGRNHLGQLGNNTTDDLYIPTQIGTDNDWKVISNGTNYTAAVKETGSLYVWGALDPGLGESNIFSSLIPLLINECQLGIEESGNDRQIKLYPNPADGIVTLESLIALNNPVLQVFDVTGRIVVTVTDQSTNRMQFDVAQLSAGMYVVVVSTRDGIMINTKLQVK